MSSSPSLSLSSSLSPRRTYNFGTITCVTWTLSGRIFALGTPDGFVVYSTEAVQATRQHAQHAQQTQQAQQQHAHDTHGSSRSIADDDDVVEVCRCVVDGGVGLLSVYEQCSVVACTGVRSYAAACTVTLCDVDSGTALRTTSSSSLLPPLCAPRVLAQATFARVVAALRFCPDMVLVGLTADGGSGGAAHDAATQPTRTTSLSSSHLLYVFDAHLRLQRRLHGHALSSAAYLNDTMALATQWQHSRGAGVCLARRRALLPGARCGHVRLLTRTRRCRDDDGASDAAAAAAAAAADDVSCDAHTAMPRQPRQQYDDGDEVTGAAYGDSRHRSRHSDGDSDAWVVAERSVHQSRLRAVAMTHDGRRGVTMGDSGTKIRLLHFAGDATMLVCATLERGRLAGVVHAASLCVCTLTQTTSSSSSLWSSPPQHTQRQQALLTQTTSDVDVVACATSTGTVHIFVVSCDEHRSSSSTTTAHEQTRVLYTRDKRLAPHGVDYPYAYALHLSPPSTPCHTPRCTLSVLQWTNAHSALRYLATRLSSPRSPSSSSSAAAHARRHGGDACGDGAAAADDAIRLVCFRLDVAATATPANTTTTTMTRTTSAAAATTPPLLLQCTMLRQYGIDHA